jgi:two-component system, NarL family, sensor kinase
MRVFCLLIAFSWSCCLAQNVQEITQNVKAEKNDSIKISMLLQAGWNLKSSQPAASHLFLNQAINLSQKTGSKKQLASAYYYKSAIHYLTSQYDSALLVSDKAIEIYEGIDDHYGVASIYNLRGLLQEKIGDYSEAIANYQHSLEHASKTENLYGQSNPIHNIGLIYDKTEDYEASLKYLERALAVRQKIGDSVLIAQSFQSIGVAHARLGDTTKSISYQKRSIVYFKVKEDWYDLALSYINLGDIYTAQKRYDSAMLLLQESLRLNTQIDNAEGSVRSLITISYVYLGKKDYANAATYANQAIAIAKQHNQKPNLKLAYINSVEAYKGLGNYQQASILQQELIALSNNLLNEEKIQQLTQMETRYRVKEKEQQISVQQTQLHLTYFIIGALTIIVALVVVIFFLVRNRLKRKQQLAEARTQNALQEERLRISQELHDNIGSQLTFVNASIEALEKSAHDSRFTDIKKLTSSAIQELRKTVWLIHKQSVTVEEFLIKLREYIPANSTPPVQFVSSGNLQIEIHATLANHVFRMVQEAVNNAIKHAQATHIQVALTVTEKVFAVEVQDNGIGFDTTTVSTGFGLRNIEKRVKAIQGTINITSRPSETVIALSVPWQP